MHTKKILVIGGSYFVGKVFIEEYLASRPVELYVFNRGRAPLALENIIEIRGDRDTAVDIKRIPPVHWDAIVDFCAYKPNQVEKLIKNLPGTVEHYILISTTSVYKGSCDFPVSETADTLNSPQPELGIFASYGHDKRLTEDALISHSHDFGIRYTIFRPSIIYGFYNYVDRESLFFDAALKCSPIVIPENCLALYSFIWVVDMAHILIKSICNDALYSGIFNLTARDLVSYEKIVSTVSECSGTSLNTIYKNNEQIKKLNIQLPFPPDRHLLYDGSAIQEKLNHRFIPFKEGIKTTFEFYKQIFNMKHEGR